MSYSRFWDSDVYIYPHVNGHIECALCLLRPSREGGKGESVCIDNDKDLIEHISQHRSAGHIVPDGLEVEILEDNERYGKYTG